MKHLYKLAFTLVVGTGLALAQTTPSASPSGAQTPDASQMGQKGASSANAQSDIQTALHKQLPNVADNVTVSSTDDNKIQLSGTVSSDAEKQQVEQIARTAAPNADVVNKLTVSGSSTSPSSDQPPASSKPPKMQLIAYQTGAGQGTPQQTPSTPSATPPAGEQTGSMSPGSQAGGDVQDKIQKAIQQDSSLSGANVNVSVTGNQVELTGTVASKDQKKTAKQIAESNAGGMKVVDHLKVEGKGANSPTPETPKN